MIIYVDIDETICTLGEHSNTKETRDYNYARPRFKQIAKINKLYDCMLSAEPFPDENQRYSRYPDYHECLGHFFMYFFLDIPAQLQILTQM